MTIKTVSAAVPTDVKAELGYLPSFPCAVRNGR